MWKRELLEEACTFISRGISPKYIEEGGVLVINQKCVRNHTIDYSLARRHDIEKKNVKPERFIQRGDVLINSTGQGTLGRVAQVRDEPPEPTTVDSHVTIVRPNLEKFYLDYFGYALIQVEDELKNSGQGTSGQTELAKTRVQKEFFASYPRDKSEQQRIVAKLDAAFAEIDRAIEVVHQQMLQTQSLQRQKTDLVFGAISGDKKTLNDVCSLITCGVAARPEYVEEGIPFLSAQNVKKGQVLYYNHKYITEQKHQELTKKNKPMRGDLLYTRVGSFGEAAVVESDIEFSVFVSLTLIKTKSELNPYYLKHYLNSQRLKTLASKSLSGSGVGNLNVGAVRKFPITLPSIERQLEVVKSLEDLVARTENLYETYRRKAAQLQSLRSAVLASELQPPHSEAA